MGFIAPLRVRISTISACGTADAKGLDAVWERKAGSRPAESELWLAGKSLELSNRDQRLRIQSVQ
jgi:hypothetical protein